MNRTLAQIQAQADAATGRALQHLQAPINTPREPLMSEELELAQRDDLRMEALALASVVIRDALRADRDASQSALDALACKAVRALLVGADAYVSRGAAPAAPAS